MESVGSIWFNRTEAKDREIVARKYVLVESATSLYNCNVFPNVKNMGLFFRLREHVQGANNNPLLIFPEGTCVNNHYTVMFKKVILIDYPLQNLFIA